MGEELLNQIALSLVPGIGPVTVKQLINYCGSATEVLTASAAKLKQIPGIGQKTVESITLSPQFEQASRQLELARKHRATIIPFTDKHYPQRLIHQDSAPTVLYAKGQPAFNRPRTLGIVGTRRATDYGRRAIRKLLSQLKPYSPTILSGLAYGIDITAHREALALSLPTVAVLGSSLDRIYPEVHKKTAEEMLAEGGLITELKFGTKAEIYHFPSRNRIIAGLSDALIVVEARKKGGALITANYTLSFGKPCFAVPGPIDSPSSTGCNSLLCKQQAQFALNGADIASALGWSEDEHYPVINTDPNSEEIIVKILEASPQGMHIDEVCRKSMIPINKMGTYMLSMELKGLIKSLPGKKFMLVGQ